MHYTSEGSLTASAAAWEGRRAERSVVVLSGLTEVLSRARWFSATTALSTHPSRRVRRPAAQDFPQPAQSSDSGGSDAASSAGDSDGSDSADGGAAGATGVGIPFFDRTAARMKQ
jgi:hypothetical protein